MANLYELLATAHGGRAVAMLGCEFELSPEETEAAVTALLPAISTASSNRRRHRKASANCLA